jgi:hypothetical protein
MTVGVTSVVVEVVGIDVVIKVAVTTGIVGATEVSIGTVVVESVRGPIGGRMTVGNEGGSSSLVVEAALVW